VDLPPADSVQTLYLTLARECTISVVASYPEIGSHFGPELLFWEVDRDLLIPYLQGKLPTAALSAPLVLPGLITSPYRHSEKLARIVLFYI
jgi:hypothetical protein